MKILKRSLMFVLLCVYLSGMIGCAPKESIAKKVSYNKLGVGDSMGCIRLTCEDAKWIYDNCPKGTKVEIYDSSNSGPLGKPTAMKIDANSPYAKWDPTDPDANNPWKTAKPTISGVTNITVLQGQEIDYISNVSAVDVFGAVLNVTTSGNVDATTVGEYIIHYTATDSRGNKVTTSATITVVEHPTDNEANEDSGIPPNLLLAF